MNRILALLALPVIAFMAVGGAWALASPPGSAADDEFHMSSIWCAWGPSETCIPERQFSLDTATGETIERVGYSVPKRIAHASCFALKSGTDARCTWLLTAELVPTTTARNVPGGYAPIYYSTMRVFVGPDAARSVLIMRFFNVLLAGILFGVALWVSRPAVRRALALGWGVAMIPLGVFFIASTNPSGWTISALGVFWAFLLTALSNRNWRSRRTIVAATGAVVSALMALAGRIDSMYVLLLSSAAVAIIGWPRLRKALHSTTSLIVGGFIALGAVAVVTLTTQLGTLARRLDQLQFPGGDAARDQPNAMLKTMLELPSFLAGLLGGQAPGWAQRTSEFDAGTPGYAWTGYTYGLGYTDVMMPSLVGILLVAAVAAMVTIGFSSSSPRKVTAVLLLSLGLITQILVVRGLVGFQQAVSALQPRYFFALFLVTICFCLIAFPSSRRLLTRAQSVLLVTSLAIAQSIALRATIARYVHGQDHSWTQLADTPRWWWPSGPSPDLLWLVGSIAGVIFVVFIFRLGNSAPKMIAKGLSVREVHPP